jgi:hypothetical protein
MLGFVLLLAGLGVIGGGLPLVGEPAFELRLEAERGLDAQSDALWWLLLAIGISALMIALWARRERAVTALIATLASTWLWLCLGAYPLLNETSSAHGLMRDVAQVLAPDDELALVDWKEQLLLQSDRPTATFGFRRPAAAQLRDAIQWQSAAPRQRWVLAQERAISTCVDLDRAYSLTQSNRRDWWLFQASALRPDCR